MSTKTPLCVMKWLNDAMGRYADKVDRKASDYRDEELEDLATSIRLARVELKQTIYTMERGGGGDS